MLDDQQIRALVSDMWLLRQSERTVLDNIYEYMLGLRGFPRVPENSEKEIQELANLSMKNVLPLVRDAFRRRIRRRGVCGRTIGWMPARLRCIGLR